MGKLSDVAAWIALGISLVTAGVVLNDHLQYDLARCLGCTPANIR